MALSHSRPYPHDIADQQLKSEDLIITGGGKLFVVSTGEWLFGSAAIIEAYPIKIGKRGILVENRTKTEWVRSIDTLVVSEKDLSSAIVAIRGGRDAKKELRNLYRTIYIQRNAGRAYREEISEHKAIVRDLRNMDVGSRKESDA